MGARGQGEGRQGEGRRGEKINKEICRHGDKERESWCFSVFEVIV